MVAQTHAILLIVHSLDSLRLTEYGRLCENACGKSESMEDIRQRREDIEADGRYTAAVMLQWNVIRFRKTQLRKSEILRRNGNEEHDKRLDFIPLSSE